MELVVEGTERWGEEGTGGDVVDGEREGERSEEEEETEPEEGDEGDEGDKGEGYIRCK